MGVDTGRALHAVILRCPTTWWENRLDLVHLGVYRDFSDLHALMEKFHIRNCVIDGLPGEFAKKYHGWAYMNFFNEHQRGEAKWDWRACRVEVNRTDALDASRAFVRERKLVLPRPSGLFDETLVDDFARHMAADAKVLDEDEETGAKRYRYIKTGENHFSLAFTYALMAAEHGEMYKPSFAVA